MKSWILAALLCCCASLVVAQTTTPEHRKATPGHHKALKHPQTLPVGIAIKTPALRIVAPPPRLNTPPVHGTPEPVPCTDTNADDLGNCGLVAFGDGHYAVARQAWELAAWRGDYLSALWLGQLYEAGKGVAKDNEQAYAWFDISAVLHARELKGDHPPGPPAISTNQTEISARDTLAKKMTKSEIEKAQQLSRDWQNENRHA